MYQDNQNLKMLYLTIIDCLIIKINDIKMETLKT